MTRTTRLLNIIGKYVLNSLLVLTCSGVIFAADVTYKGPYDDETEQQRNERMAWWREARFGLFIHWGVYSVPAGTHKGEQIENIGEWIMHYGKIPVAEYQEYAKQFNPVDYDPEAWVRMAKDAGMKYIVITAKHHDGHDGQAPALQAGGREIHGIWSTSASLQTARANQEQVPGWGTKR